MVRKRRKKINVSLQEQQFMSLEVFSGLVLLFCSLLALVLSNSPWAEIYHKFWKTEIGISMGSFHISYSLHHWINDGLMAVFFFVIGLEIKRELLFGELSSKEKVILPIIAAIGGAALPALLYFIFNRGTEGAKGWGIPMATDIAFVLGVIAILGTRVPKSIRIFILAFAIIDDIIAIIIIAVFYTQDIHINSLIFGLALIAVGTILTLSGVYNQFFFFIIGIFAWFMILGSGVHPTLAGVAMAITVPTSHITNFKKRPEYPMNDLINLLHPVSSFFIIPLFALSNAGIKISTDFFNSLFHPISLGIIAGLFIGKPVGIFLSIWTTIKLKLSVLPEGANWKHILAMASLGGMGFTLSLFISVLAFDESVSINYAKFGVLSGSLISVITGCILFIINGNSKKIVS
jgi:Na+:H+ antiporter, NhaA family